MSDNILEQLKELLEGIYFSLNEGKLEETKRKTKNSINDKLARRGEKEIFGPEDGTIDASGWYGSSKDLGRGDSDDRWYNHVTGRGVRKGEVRPKRGTNNQNTGRIADMLNKKRQNSSTTLERLGQTLIESLSNLLGESTPEQDAIRYRGLTGKDLVDAKMKDRNAHLHQRVIGTGQVEPGDEQVTRNLIHGVKRAHSRGVDPDQPNQSNRGSKELARQNRKARRAYLRKGRENSRFNPFPFDS